MAVTDSVGDALTKIRNASRAKHPIVEARYSGLLLQILESLKQEGFIRSYKILGERPSNRLLRIYLKYSKNAPALAHVKRVSRPGMRIYRRAEHIPRVLGGLGVALVSTSQGVLTGREAFRRRIGGEVLCYVW